MPPLPSLRAITSQSTTSSSIGASEISRLTRKLRSLTTGSASTTTPLATSVAHRSSWANTGRWVVKSV